MGSSSGKLVGLHFLLNSLLQGKMSQKVKPFVQSLKSMPADYRFLGSPISDPVENSSGSTVCVTDLVSPRNGYLRNGVNGNEHSVGGMDSGGNEDSPYSVRSVSNGERSSIGDSDLIVPLPQSDDRRWSDTSAYARKKVPLRFLYCNFSYYQFWCG